MPYWSVGETAEAQALRPPARVELWAGLAAPGRDRASAPFTDPARDAPSHQGTFSPAGPRPGCVQGQSCPAGASMLVDQGFAPGLCATWSLGCIGLQERGVDGTNRAPQEEVY